MENNATAHKNGTSTLLSIAWLIIAIFIVVAILYALLEYLNINKYYESWLVALISLIFGAFVTVLISKAIKEYIIANGVKQEASTISRLFSIVSYTTVAIIALYLIHVNVTGLLVSAGFLGIVLGLAAQPSLGNVFSGISMIIAKPFEPGDYITVQTWQYSKMPSTYPHEEFIPGYSGIVAKIGLLYTEIVGDTKTPLYVPNNILNQALVINHHRTATKTLRIRIEISRKVPFTRLERYIKMVLKKRKAIKDSVISIEHISESTYGVSIAALITDKDADPGRLKALILKNLLDFISAYEKSS